MNLLLPYGSNLINNIKCLDDQSLSNQIIDCYNILKEYLDNQGNYKYVGNKLISYYIKIGAIPFIDDYGQIALLEYKYRFEKYHKYDDKFMKLHKILYNLKTTKKNYDKLKLIFAKEIQVTDLKIDYIIKTKNIDILYQHYLTNIWEEKIKEYAKVPEWTRREIPEFFPINNNNIRGKQK